ncbi:unnamed protein product, partial [Mesorhabditis belari]|uniref:Aminoacyl-transfer RNA synthetases class-II family profile domain-containing protein n=1 Tax=Mesorhabditis belari TaxID=2138241 RepID=A0AAF3ETF4_9BILA
MLQKNVSVLFCRSIRRFASSLSNIYANRTHTCGELRSSHIGVKVSLSGWLEFRRMDKFLVLRDAYGQVQAYIPENQPELREMMKELTYESVLRLDGIVRSRGKNVNTKMPTGEVEIEVNSINLINEAPKALPLRPGGDASEETRLKFRYLDLRTPQMQETLRLRSRLVHDMRRFLVEKRDFVDVETPILFRRTPGGAAEFQVPAPKPNRGRCYSLPQSPQQFKQLLMVGGLDRYFQIARCFRDEGSKIDRQPEFTQVDLELSFTNQEGVIKLLEDLIVESWPQPLESFRPNAPFRRISYNDAMKLYGTDKPDLRIPWKIQDASELFPHLLTASSSSTAACVVCADAAASVTNKIKQEWKRLIEMNSRSAKFAIFDGSKEKWFKEGHNVEEIKRKLNVGSNDLCVISWGNEENVLYTLGQMRNHVAEGCGLRKKQQMEFLWVVDFPLFVEEEGRLVSAHHPFTAPVAEDFALLRDQERRKSIRGQHYDLVLNGVELGGGSIRIHNGQVQEYVLNEILQEDHTELSHLIEALKHGAPPHGGFAIGLDRYVALLVGKGDTSVSVRETIAFPKSHTGRDVMSDAPAIPTQKQLDKYGFAFVVKDEKTTENDS